MLGKGGHDELYGAQGGDSLSDDDEVYGGSGNDEVRGGNGQDDVYGGRGSDDVVGGEGIDYLSGGGNNDTINSLDGRPDIVSCGLGDDDQVTVDEEDNVATECDRVTRQ